MSSHTPASPQRHWLRNAGLILVLALALIALGWFTLTSQGDAPSSTPKVATVHATLVQVAREDVPNFLLGVGTAQALATVTVKTRLDGQLERVNFVEGEDVKAGQVLAQIDARPLRAQLEQAQAQKAKDEAQLANAKLDLDRYIQLIKEEATTQQILDTQRALVAQLQAAVQNDAAQIHYAQIQLSYATITAPLSGRAGARLVDPGNIVHASDANGLVVINQINPIAVVFTLPGDVVQTINHARQAGQRLTVLAYSREGEVLLARGQLVLVNNQIDIASGTVQLKARFANPQHALWPGQYVNVRLLLGEHAQASTVPAAVIQRGPSGTYAYVVSADGKAQMRLIEVLQIQDDKAVISKGLQAGETVVLDGQYKIKPGVAVVANSSSTTKDAANPKGSSQ